VQERIELANKTARAFESPFFYYFGHLVQMIGYFIEARKVSDQFFKVKESIEGKALLGLAKELKHKTNMYKGQIGQESFKKLIAFIREYEGDFFGKMDTQTEREILELSEERVEYQPSVIQKIEALYSILAVTRVSRTSISRETAVKRKTQKRTTLMAAEAMVQEQYKWESKETPLLCFEVIETSPLVIEVLFGSF
jgi:hypothetical protein